MSSTSYLRGHPIFKKDGVWFYVDTDTPTIGVARNCGHCGNKNSKEGHDGCLGTLPGVMNACCGHGIKNEAYLQFSPEKCLHGEDAINEINRMLDKPLSYYLWPGLVCHWTRPAIPFCMAGRPISDGLPASGDKKHDFNYHPSLEQARHHQSIPDEQLAIPVR